jgi:hypothetical protein
MATLATRKRPMRKLLREFGFNPSIKRSHTAVGPSKPVREEFTLPRWVEAVEDELFVLSRLCPPQIDP